MRLEKSMTVSQAALLLGVHSTTATRWLAKGEMPGYKIGGRWAIPYRPVCAWLAERGVQAADEPDPDATRRETYELAARLWDEEDSVFDEFEPPEAFSR